MGPSRRERAHDHDWIRGRAVPLAIAAYGIAYVAWLGLSGASESVRSLVANLGYLPVGAVSAALAWRISTRDWLPGRLRLGWRILTLACVLTLTADLWWAVDENLLGLDPSASWVNVVYLLYYVALLAGLLCFPDALRSRQDAVKFGLDAATVVVGGGMLVWHFVIAPTLHAGTSSAFTLVTSVCYPVGDLLALLGVSVILLRCPRGPRRRPIVLLAVSVTAMMIGDLVWAHLSLRGDYQAGNLQDVLFMTQYVLFAAAAAEQLRRPSPADGLDAVTGIQPFSLLPYLGVLAGYGLLLLVGWRGATPALFQLMLGAMLLTVLVISRQVIAVRENVRMSKERAILASEARFRSLIQNASDIVSIIDDRGRFTYVSPSAVQMLGRPSDALIGTPVLEIIHPDDVHGAAARLKESLDSARPMTGRWRLMRSDGTWVQTDNICTNLMHDDNIRGVVLNIRDVSEQCALEAQLMHQAFHDPLTGLANRALFENRVTQALSHRRDDGHTVGVLFIDLDNFKTVNDSLGHAAGDALLAEIAVRLSRCLRPADTVARLGGDEFSVLVADIPREDVARMTDRVTRVCQEPVWVDGRELLVSSSVGVALATPQQSAQDLLRNADLAMYLAKSRGGGQAARFEPDMHAAALERLELIADVRHAVHRDEFHVVYQPIHRLEDGALISVEALLRWRHPQRGAVAPRTFIPIAEETGDIVPIGRFVLERACRDGRTLQERIGGVIPLRITVNLSARQIIDPGLVGHVRSALTTSGLAPGSLVLELTESTLFEHTDHILSVMNDLKAAGVQLAIDDFGTGYSSLSYLQRLPIDILKIDRAFVERIDSDDNASAVATMIVGLGKSLTLRTVAEGIETATQARALKELGCDLGQGYFFSEALLPTDVEHYASRYARFDAA